MKKVFFVTGNNAKFEQVNRWIKELNSNIELEQVKLEIPEYQSLDIVYVAKNKAKEAFKVLNAPLIIDDFGIYLENYNNFPGPLAKFVFEGIGLNGFWKLAKENPTGFFRSCFVYVDKVDNEKFFEGSSKGNFIDPKNLTLDVNLPYTHIFIPDGSIKTLAEIKGTPEEKKYNHRFKAVKNWLNDLNFIQN